MPKVPSLTPLQLIKILERSGFVFDRSKGSHRIYIHPETNKRAVVPFHKKDVPKGTLLEILKQAGVSPDELQGCRPALAVLTISEFLLE